MTKTWIAGDWHRNELWAKSVIHSARSRGIDRIYQVGDFGLWPGEGGERYLEQVSAACDDEVVVYVTPGNHENWDAIDNVESEEQWLTDSICFLPRGHTFEYGGLSWMSMGGAPSIDFQHRTKGVSWWPAETIRDEDIERVVGPVDVLLAHDSPNTCTGPVKAILENNDWGWSRAGLMYAAEGRMQMDKVFELASPRLLFHGHYHVSGYREIEESNQKLVSLDMDGCITGNIVELDTETEEMLWVTM